MAIVIAALLPFVLGTWTPLVAVGLFLALWIVGATIVTVMHRLAGMPQAGPAPGMPSQMPTAGAAPPLRMSRWGLPLLPGMNEQQALIDEWSGVL